MTPSQSSRSTFHYEIGGSLSSDAPTYVVREADEDLYETLKAGKFCYVLNSRQMGKSSLRVRTMQRLKEAGIACAEVDLTGVGSQGLTEEQWYGGVVNELIRGLQLPESFDWRSWWRERAPLAHVQRWGRFIEEVLLTHIQQDIVIFIDEIDSVLGLQFPFDDFFAQIRFCHNKRADDPAYQRLTFCLLGVATPSDLIQDRRRTPFNIGRAIELSGFRLSEATPLAKGLVDKTKNPQAVLKAILQWTGGQPFLTQKVCQLIIESSSPIPANEEESWVEQFVRTKVIENWESQDEPEHLRTIRNRIFRSEQNASHVLKLYQQILEQSQISADNSPEQAELRLSGLVVKQQGMLEVYNPIYRAVFNQQWVEEAIAKLQPQDEAIAERLGAIRDTVLQHKSCVKLLELYQRILQQTVEVEDTPEAKLLLNLGLIKPDEGQLKVANRVYSNFFNQDWVEQELDKSRQRRIIRQRYEVIEKLDSGSSIQTYLVKDLQHPSRLQCILKQITPPSEVGAFASMHNQFTNAYLELQQLNTHPDRQIANLIACFDEDEKFYIVQEFVPGHNLDCEMNPEHEWSEAKVVDLLIEILEILEFTHALNLAHLNLKPSNIRRRDSDNKLVLIDIGTLKQLGTPAENSGEQPPFLIGSAGYVPAEGGEAMTETELDVFATGMIGIQALTGIEPKDLAINRLSGEIIWRFSTLKRQDRTISAALTLILDKMISLQADARYADIAGILQELRQLRELGIQPPQIQKKSRLFGKRFFAGVALSLVLTSTVGYLWQQQSWKARRNEWRTTRCQIDLKSQKAGSNPIDAELTAQAKRIEESCNWLLQQEPGDDQHVDVLSRRGQALLLLGRSSQNLKQDADAKKYFIEAQKSFQDALISAPDHPQNHFYLGLTKQLLAFTKPEPQYLSYKDDYQRAIELYLKQDDQTLQMDDYPILVKLAAYLPQYPRDKDYQPDNFKQADQLYARAIQLYQKNPQPDKASLVNLYIIRGVLNARSERLNEATPIFGDAQKIDSQNQNLGKYMQACQRNDNSLFFCEPPFASPARVSNPSPKNPARSTNPVPGSKKNAPVGNLTPGSKPANPTVTRPTLPSILPVYDCQEYPILAIARLGSANPEQLCR